MDDLLVGLTLVTALGCGLSAGALYAFSSFAMPALARLPAAQGIAAMQSINVMAPTPPFMTAFLGAVAGCVVVVVWALVDWDGSFGPWLLAGSVLYLVGLIGVTRRYNIPRNNALAAADPADPGSEALWRRYVTEWTRWNHVRTVAGIAATAALTGALIVD
jgi:uncharacterized membrane protein